MPSANPSVSIITLNWNGLTYLPACLAALGAQTYRNFELLIVENGSTDGSVAYLAQPELFRSLGFAAAQVRVLHSPTNLGFSGGNNFAFAQTQGDYIATINNDTVANPDWLAQMVAALDNDAARDKSSPYTVGMIGAALLFTSRPDTIAAAGLEMHRDGLALERRAGQHYRADLPPYEIFGPTAGAALYSRRMLDEVGFFDERFFAYLEDVDLAWRARLRGWRCLYAPAAAVLHHYSATGGQGSPFKSYHLARNRIWTIVKNLPGGLLREWRLYILRYEAMAMAYGLLRRDKALLRGRIDALRQLGTVLTQRATIQSQRTISNAELAGWFHPPVTVSEMLGQRQRTDALAL